MSFEQEFNTGLPDPNIPDLDQMRFALAQRPGDKYNDPDIPLNIEQMQARLAQANYQKAQYALAHPLDAVVNNFKEIATNFNPMLFGAMARDFTKTAVLQPLALSAGPLLAGAKAVNAAPGLAYRDYVGGEQNKREAEEIRLNLPTANQEVRRMQEALAPTTPAGQQFQEGLGRILETAKVPHAWPVAGGISQRRPALTPNDARVMGAQAVQGARDVAGAASNLGREISRLPDDIANAQQGITRLTPQGAPAPAARVAQAVVDTGRALTETGMPAMPGVPGGVFIDPNMYAIRPTPSNISYPRYPDTAQIWSRLPSIRLRPNVASGLANLGTDILGKADARNSIDASRLLSSANADSRQRYDAYAQQYAESMYPGLEPDAAKASLFALHSTSAAQAALEINLYNAFVEANPDTGLVSTTEFEARRDASRDFINDNYLPYLSRTIGTALDPGLKLAQAGITVISPNELQNEAGPTYTQLAVSNRKKAPGIDDPTGQGTTQPLIDTLNAEAKAIESELSVFSNHRLRQISEAEAAGIPHHQLPAEHYETRDAIEAGNNRLATIAKEIKNLEIGRNYEIAADTAVTLTTQGALKAAVSAAEQQFMPRLAAQRAENPAYIASGQALADLGYGLFGEYVVNKIMDGTIPLSKVPKLKVENLLRDYATGETTTRNDAVRKKEEERQAVAAHFKTTVATGALNATPLAGGVTVIKLDQSMSWQDIARRQSEDTHVLNTCIGDGGGGVSPTDRNEWTDSSQKYGLLVDLLTGEPLKRAIRAESTYGKRIRQGTEEDASFRDSETGLPGATLNFVRPHINQPFKGHFVSGPQNGIIAPKFYPAITEYLNANPQYLNDAGQLHDHAGLYDLRNPDSLELLKQQLTRAEKTNLRDVMTSGELGDLNGRHIYSVKSIRDMLQEDSTIYWHVSAEAMRNDLADLRTDMSILRRHPANPENIARLEDMQNQVNDIEQRQQALVDSTHEGIPPDVQYLWDQLDLALDPDSNGNQHQAAMREIIRDNWSVEAARENPIEIVIDIRAAIEQRLARLNDERASGNFELVPEEDSRFAINDMTSALARLENLSLYERDVQTTAPPTRLAGLERAEADAVSRIHQLRLESGMNRPELTAAYDDRDLATRNLIANVSATAYIEEVDGRLGEIRRAIRDLRQGINDSPLIHALPTGQQRAAMEALAAELELQTANRVDEVQQPGGAPGFSIDALARYVIREHEGNPGRLQDVIRGLRGGHTDLFTIETLPSREQLPTMLRLADLLEQPQEAGAGLQGNRPEQPVAPQLAERSPISASILGASTTQLEAALTLRATDEGTEVGNQYLEANQGLEDLQTVVYLIRSYRMGLHAMLSEEQRELIARRIETSIADRLPIETLTASDRELYANFNAIIGRDIEVSGFEINNYDNSDLAQLVLDDEGGGFDNLTDAQRLRLSNIVYEYGFNGRLPDGNAHGGPVRGYQDGGSVKTPSLITVPLYAETVAYDMYPGQLGQDDQRDAARHMLAAGTLSRKYGEGPAKFLGRAHEYATSPYQALKTLFGGKMPPDFEMDTHNNDVGVILARQAKNQEDFERLVQSEAERASKDKQPGRAYTKKAHGGTIHTTPSLDDMRLALMRRQ